MKSSILKKAYIFVAILLIGFSFSACSSDNDRGYWVQGAVDFSVEPVTAYNGYFERTITLNESFIRDLRDQWIDPRYVENWRLVEYLNPDFESFARVSNMHIYGNGVIRNFEILLDGDVVYQDNLPIELIGDHPADACIIKNVDYYRAMRFVLQDLMRYGSVNITVRGRTNLNNIAEPIYFDFINSVEFYLR